MARVRWYSTDAGQILITEGNDDRVSVLRAEGGDDYGARNRLAARIQFLLMQEAEIEQWRIKAEKWDALQLERQLHRERRYEEAMKVAVTEDQQDAWRQLCKSDKIEGIKLCRTINNTDLFIAKQRVDNYLRTGKDEG